MASYSIRFLGCKVSHVDTHAIRERLLADHHPSSKKVRRSPSSWTSCITHEVTEEGILAA